MKCASVSHSVMSDSLWSLVLYSPPGSSVPGILQARILEWVAIPSSRASSWPRDRTQVSCIAGWFFTIWATRESLRNTMVTIYHQILPNTSSDSSSPWGKTYPSVTQPLLLGPMSWSQEGSWGHSWPQGLFCPMAPETALSNASSMTPPLPLPSLNPGTAPLGSQAPCPLRPLPSPLGASAVMRMTNLQWPPVPWLSSQPFHTTQRPTRMARWCIVDLLIAQTAFLWNLEFLNHDLPSTFPCMSVVILIPRSPERCCPFPPRFFCFSISLAPHWFILFLQQMLTWHLWCARQCSGPRDATELRVLQPLLHWWTTYITFAMHPRHLWLVSSFGI